jgi:hypothetical protein
MNWAEYVNAIPKTLHERALERSNQYRREKLNEYERTRRKRKAAKKVVQQLLEGKTA